MSGSLFQELSSLESFASCYQLEEAPLPTTNFFSQERQPPPHCSPIDACDQGPRFDPPERHLQGTGENVGGAVFRGVVAHHFPFACSNHRCFFSYPGRPPFRGELPGDLALWLFAFSAFRVVTISPKPGFTPFKGGTDFLRGAIRLFFPPIRWHFLLDIDASFGKASIGPFQIEFS